MINPRAGYTDRIGRDAWEATVTARSGSQSRGALAAAVVALVVAAGCAVGGVGESGPQAPREPAPGQSRQASSPGPQTTRADGTTSVEEFKTDIGDAVNIAEDYWGAQFKSSGQQFRPIRRIVPYQREGEVAWFGLLSLLELSPARLAQDLESVPRERLAARPPDGGSPRDADR